MDNSILKKFAQNARKQLKTEVESRLEYVLSSDAIFQKENEHAIAELKSQLNQKTRDELIDQTAYLWFNRFCALRFMDVKGYTPVGIVSPSVNHSQPQILKEAKDGVFSIDLTQRQKAIVADLISGNRPAENTQTEAYRILLVAYCNQLNSRMPFLFEKIADFSELLMPLDLLSEQSVLFKLREAMTPDSCKDVEVIGWLYQYYISERKDEVFANFKKGKKAEPQDIPAATQLFTPNWIVRYLVENSLGRLWLLNKPNSKLASKMQYYIAPVEQEKDFFKVDSPEDLRICDPACGSGHMLVYAFDLLYSIYEEEGYDSVEIPKLILGKNLYGIEIDERARELAAFALVMKACERRRRFLDNPVQPRVRVLENIKFTSEELDQYFKNLPKGILSDDLLHDLKSFEEAKNFGSLITPKLQSAGELKGKLLEINLLSSNQNSTKSSNSLFAKSTHERVLRLLEQVDILSSKYHVVIANPPYMGRKKMNAALSKFASNQYPQSESDLYSMFIERSLSLSRDRGIVGLVTMQNWMFLSTSEEFRKKLLADYRIESMIHLGAGAFEAIGGEVMAPTAFILRDQLSVNSVGIFLRLVDFHSHNEKSQRALDAIRNQIRNQICSYVYRIYSYEFSKIPGNRIIYWASSGLKDVFKNSRTLSEISTPRAGLSTGDNNIFQRNWWEVSYSSIFIDSENPPVDYRLKWYPCNSGGSYRKWYGNNEIVVDWQDNGRRIRDFKDLNGKLRSRPQNVQFYFKPGVTWTKLSSDAFCARLREPGFVFDDTGRSAFPEDESLILPLLSLLCSTYAKDVLTMFNSTMSFTSGDIGSIPVQVNVLEKYPKGISHNLITIYKQDWDSKEKSWNFEKNPLLNSEHIGLFTISSHINRQRSLWQELTKNALSLEEESNEYFIKSYNLEKDYLKKLELKDVTLFNNPVFIYGDTKSKSELETLQTHEYIIDLISYSVGCMFGRYSIDKDGLILASQGETLKEYFERVPNPRFKPDEDNVIPILNESWFGDDIVERFKTFLKVTFGQENFQENLAFIEQSIGCDIRKYFVKDFFSEHVKRYNKRPIYWMFSSPKGSFNALIYMHRYRSDTVSVLLNDYLREFQAKLTARIETLKHIENSETSKASDKTSALKERNKIASTLQELSAWEKDVVYRLATSKIEIDLDDGVKANYSKFKGALKPIKGLEVEDE